MIQYAHTFPDQTLGGLLGAFFKIWEGGIIFYGSALGGVIGYGLFYHFVLRKLHINGWKLADLHATIDPFNPGPVIPSSLRPAAPSVPPDAAAPADPSPPVNPKDAAIPAYLPLVALGIAALALLLGALGAFLLGRSGNVAAVAVSISEGEDEAKPKISPGEPAAWTRKLDRGATSMPAWAAARATAQSS